MSDRYPGGLIRKTPPTVTPPVNGEGGSAPGIWTLEQASYYQGIGEWPKKVIARELYSWGYGAVGALGQNSTLTVSSPVQVGSLITWSQVSSGNEHTAAVTTVGSLFTFGGGYKGRLGHNNDIDTSSPVQVGALTTWSQASASYRYTAAVKTDGTLWTWGEGLFGKLGHNNLTTSSSPVQVGALTAWAQVSAGKDHCAAVKTDGTLWTWGDAVVGKLGHNDVVLRSSPVQVGALTNWSQVTAGLGHCAAVKTDGTLWTWGAGANGRLGTNIAIYAVSSPVQVGALTTWLQVSAHDSYSNIAVKTNGTIWTWGNNDNGQLGQNITLNVSSPIQVGPSTDWSQVTGSVSAAMNHCGAVKTDGTIWTWGLGANGRTGHNNTISLSSPVQVGALTTWSKASLGGNHTAAITG